MTTQPSDSDILPEKLDPLRDSAILSDRPLPEGLGGSALDDDETGQGSSVAESVSPAEPPEQTGGGSVFEEDSAPNLNEQAAGILKEVESTYATVSDTTLPVTEEFYTEEHPGEEAGDSGAYEYEYEEEDSGQTNYRASRQSSSSMGSVILAAVLGPLTVLIAYFIYSAVTEKSDSSSKGNQPNLELDDFPDEMPGLSEEGGFQPQSRNERRNRNPYGRKFERTDFLNQPAEETGLLIPEMGEETAGEETNPDAQERRAKELLRLTLKLVRKNPTVARSRLEGIVRDFPDTDAAQEARTLLAIMQQ